MNLQPVKDRYQHFAEDECKGYSNHYYNLAHEIAEDDWLLQFIAEMPVVQPNLFLAALQYLTGPEQMPRNASEARALVESHYDEVRKLMLLRRTQTNEPGRCSAILPALPIGPLALVEVGASAGLCLLLDEYTYEYGNVLIGPEHSAVRLPCMVTGNPPLPESCPEIVWRAGLDLNPLDVHDGEDVRWLISLVWPEHHARRERLAAAIRLAQEKNLSMHRGDLVSELPALLADVPSEATLVIFHTAVLVYVSEVEREDFADVLLKASLERDITWISNESAEVVPEITALAPPVAPFQKLLGRTCMKNGRRQDEFLAVAHLHGAELDWRGNVHQKNPGQSLR